MRIALFFFAVSGFCHQLQIDVSARSAIVMNADTGAILYEKHAHIPAYPASITKIATALYVLDSQKEDLSKLCTVSAEALRQKPVNAGFDCPAYWGESDGSKMGLKKGEILPLNVLLYGLMRVSGNDAANVIAESCAPSIPDFVESLNEYVKGLGCVSTQFLNPHGLHHPEHFTTPYDMCLITSRALRIPKFRELVSSTPFERPQSNKQKGTPIVQSNALLKPGKYFYPKAIGVKTGFHAAAQNTLVAAAEHEGRLLIAVLLGCKDRGERYADAIRLFEAAFAQPKRAKKVFGRMQKFTRLIPGIKSPIRGGLKKDLMLEFFPAEEPECKAAIHWNKLELPIRKGEKIGEIHLSDQKGRLLQVGDLVSREERKAPLLYRIKKRLGWL